MLFKQGLLKKIIFLSFMLLAVFAISANSAMALKWDKKEKQNIVIIGDRVVDIAYNLGVYPAGMSVRCALWPMCAKIKLLAQPVGCPGCLSKGKRQKLMKCINQNKIKHIIIEKSDPYCILMPKANPLDSVEFLKKKGFKVSLVDFSKGLESAILQTAELLGKQEAGKALVAKYKKNVAKLQKKLKGVSLNKKVVVFHGVYQSGTGKGFVQVEAPGGYTDQFILKPLGCENVGNVLVSKGKKPLKGNWTVRKLVKLPQANPDVIVITGDATSVQRALAAQIVKNPELAKIPVFSLPKYLDSSVIERPQIVGKWLWALK